MGDFDYFYTFDNFIGYTGDLFGSPTLYFMDQMYYGRITIAHPDADNVGRGAPRLLEGYTFQNCWVKYVNGHWQPCQAEDDGAEWRLYEKNTRLGKTHTSRNVLVVCMSERTRPLVKAKVLDLIAKNTQVKSKDDNSDW
jgi:hypothetical protein